MMAEGVAQIASPDEGTKQRFAEMAASIVGSFPSGERRAWLEASWADPTGFDQVLFAEMRRRSRSFSSRGDGTIDLFHDLIVRHQWEYRAGAGPGTAGQVAFCYVPTGGSQLCAVGYDELLGAAVRLACCWVGRGMRAGSTLCIVASPGLARVVGLLAGLCVGVRLSLVQPLGRQHVRNRLALLAPDHVASVEGLSWYGFCKEVLPLEPPRSQVVGEGLVPYRYAPDEPVLGFVSPLAHGSEALVVLTAGECMARLLCDGLLLLPVVKGERVSALGRVAELVEPTLWMVTWLMGGTYVELDGGVCQREPRLLRDAALQVVLAGGRLLPWLLAEVEALVPSLRRWFVDPTGELRWQEGWRLAERLAELGVLVSNGVYLAPLGGTLAWSPKGTRLDPLQVLPAPGLPWSLQDVSGALSAVPVDHGVLRVEGRSRGQTGDLLVAATQQAFGLAGATTPRIGGRCYPRDEVVELLEALPQVLKALVVVLPSRFVMNDGEAHLLVFVDPYRDAGTVGGAGLMELVTRELGPAARASKLEVVPLAPRLRAGKVDPVWAHGQYVSGMMFKKRESEAFRCLARLGYLFAAMQAQGGA